MDWYKLKERSVTSLGYLGEESYDLGQVHDVTGPSTVLLVLGSS